MARIKKNDQVIVIAGKDKGKTGRVLKVIPETNRVNGSRTGGIETVEASIHASNVMLVDPETKQRTRVGFRLEEGERPNGRKRTIRVRYAKKSGKDV